VTKLDGQPGTVGPGGGVLSESVNQAAPASPPAAYTPGEASPCRWGGRGADRPVTEVRASRASATSAISSGRNEVPAVTHPRARSWDSGDGSGIC